MRIEKTLLIYNSVEFFRPLIKEKGVKCYPMLNQIHGFRRYIRKFSLVTNIFRSYWYREWKEQLKHTETVIVFTAPRIVKHIKYIAKNYPHIRLIVWYWNPVFRGFYPDKLNKYNVEFWSFDPEDCLRYNLKFNTTFYFKEIKIPEKESTIDILFLGLNKGRRQYLDELNVMFEASNLTTKFYIVADKDEKGYTIVKPLPYETYLELVASCRCILDIVAPGQSGLTIRVMEAIFLKKKLITNDIKILNEDFYNRENIFILEYDKQEDLVDFVNTPYLEISTDVVCRYDFVNWLKRFQSR